jgi:hypothetical protein
VGPLRRVVAKGVEAVCGASESWGGGGVDGSSRPAQEVARGWSRGLCGASERAAAERVEWPVRAPWRVRAEVAEWSGGAFRRPSRRVLSERAEVVREGSVRGVGGVGGGSAEGGGGGRGVVRRGLSETFSEGAERTC